MGKVLVEKECNAAVLYVRVRQKDCGCSQCPVIQRGLAIYLPYFGDDDDEQEER